MLVAGQSDLEWFNSNVNRLIQEFDNKFVAFKDKQIIESDTDLDRLMSKLNKQGVDTSDLFIRFISKIKTIL